jgi:subtilisin family serine protease
VRTSVRFTVSAVAVSATVLAGLAAVAANSADAAGSQHTVAVQRAASGAIKGAYIVRLKAGTDARGLARALQVSPRFVYTAAVNGFAADLTDGQLRALQRNTGVEAISEDAYVTDALEDTQPNPPSWGIDRVDQRNLPLDQSYSYSLTGANVNAYIIDTGIRFTHREYVGRVKAGIDAIDNDNDPSDCMGHGTHVAGTVGGTSFGIAKKVTLWAVRVLNCRGSGTTAQVVAGVDWVTAHAVKPAVANMSLGGDADDVLDEAVRRSIASGIPYGIAAGNDNGDACTQSPARVREAITAGATYLDDSRARFSNKGPCVDLFAPGLGITSAWVDSDTAQLSASGTSMAAPHVTGVAALYLSAHPDATAREVHDAIVDTATPGKVTDPGTGSPNKLLFVDSGVVPPPPPPGCGRRTNDSDVPIPDAGQPVATVVKYAQCAGKAPRNLKVEVHVKHPFIGDLRVDLIGPSGTAYRLKNNSSAEGGTNLDKTYRVDVSTETKDGSWFLQVQDRSEGAVGYLDSWSMTLPRR